jgi:hypothetical protein
MHYSSKPTGEFVTLMHLGTQQQQQRLHHTGNKHLKYQHAYKAEGKAALFLANPTSSAQYRSHHIGCIDDSQ